MTPISNFRAFWHPGQNGFGIEIATANRQRFRLQVDTPEEFIAALAILNGPSPALTPEGHLVCQR